jgi:hypothetical protein
LESSHERRLPTRATLWLVFAYRSGTAQNWCFAMQSPASRLPHSTWILKMRITLATTTIALIALHGTVNAVPLRACAQVSALVEGAVRPLFANLAELHHDAVQLRAQFRSCLSSRNICSVVHNAAHGKQALVAGDVTADLPEQYVSEQDKSSVVFLVRSIPRVRNDSNQYCLVSEGFSGATSVQQWNVYGWVIAPNAGEPLPLQRQLLNDRAESDPRSLRGLAAALWFFAERMSGQPSP